VSQAKASSDGAVDGLDRTPLVSGCL